MFHSNLHHPQVRRLLMLARVLVRVLVRTRTRFQSTTRMMARSSSRDRRKRTEGTGRLSQHQQMRVQAQEGAAGLAGRASAGCCSTHRRDHYSRSCRRICSSRSRSKEGLLLLLLVLVALVPKLVGG